jgi:hypothetical protein
MGKRIFSKKAHAEHRMLIAVNRGMAAATADGKNRALRWVAAWALVAIHGNVEVAKKRMRRLEGTRP